MLDILRFLNWYLIITLVGLVSLPITYRFFAHLPSRGFAFARPFGLLLWGFAFWLLCSLGILQNNTGGVVLAFLLLLAFSAWSVLKAGWQEIINWLKSSKKTILTMEILFFAAFALWAVVRAANPEAAYTEKPMELAFINSILKSPTFPPQDPWLSGYAISYYYFGYVLISMLVRVSGVASSIAFNLSSALWFGLTALAVYGIVFDLLAARKGISEQKDEKKLRLARTGGFLGPLFVLIISCLEGVLEFLYSWGAFWKPDAQGNLTSKFWTWLSVSELDVAPTLGFSWFPNRTGGWLWWRGSRIIQDLSLTNSKIEVIDEFPFFSYLLSDLHPHVLAMPFGLLAVGICLNLFLGPKSFYAVGGSILKWFKRWDFWLIALVMGSLAFINTWDFPIYVGLFCLTITYLRIKEHGWGWIRIWEFIKYGLVTGLTGVILFLPFYLGFSSQAGGILPSMEYMTRGVHFWILFGALLVPIMIWLIFQFRKIEKPRKLFSGLKIGLIIFSGMLLVSLLYGLFILNMDQAALNMMASSNQQIVSLGTKISSAYQAFVGLHGSSDSGLIVSQALLRRLVSPGTWITLLVIFTLVWSILAEKKTKHSLPAEVETAVEPSSTDKTHQSRNFVCLILLVGVALTAFPEFFYLRDQFGWRMNTIFKFYFEAWILWGIAAAYASVDLLAQLKGFKSWLFNIVWIVTILGGLAYPVVMLWQKTNQFNPSTWTLDGNAYIAVNNQDDYSAMQWLSQQPLGVVSEAIGGSYSEFARVSTRTGMPTVLGWPGHEGQWRGGYTEVGSREDDIRDLYSSDDWSQTMLIIERYNIRYIYLGYLEKSLYETDGEKFRTNLPVVYENNNVAIFEVPANEGE